jgi:S1-C subfamily serine protease
LITQQMGVAGVVILRTSPGSAASAAGLRGTRSQRDGAIVAGDIILAVNGHSTESVTRLQSRLDDYDVGDTVKLTVLREKQRIEVTVRLQASGQ